MASKLFSAGSFSSSSLSTECTYHVFLSFRGADTRKTFLGHLYNALVQAGIHTFKDDEELPPGEEISQHLKKAIQESKISIVVFSRDYASSRWCLNELVEILECRNTKGRTVFPIFCGVDPSHVRKQEGSFKKAFKAYEDKEEKEKINKWKNALKDAANLSGKDIYSTANGDESVLIKKIVKDVLNKLDIKNLNIPKYLVGIDSCVNNIIKSLNASDDVSMVGIRGMPGMGKTTIAKVVYQKLFQKFDGSCFLFDVNEKSKGPDSKVELQKQLIRETLGVNILKRKKISDVDSGISLIKNLLGNKKILLVLDGMDQPQQLDTFGGRSVFAKGSKIIITTTNEKLLAQLKVNKKHSVEEWDEEICLDLFNFHAFEGKTPEEEWAELSKVVVEQSGKLPSALVVLGNRFSQISERDEWEKEIYELRKFPDQIHSKLKGSYDSLEDDLKSIFLDIACFFVGEDVDFVASILGGRYRYCNNLRSRIQSLQERSLIRIDFDDTIMMNDLVQKMGREIVRQTSHKYPGKHSRIWDHEDALDVLINHMGTESVEGLALDEFDEDNMQTGTEDEEGLGTEDEKGLGTEDEEGRTLDVQASKFLTLRTEYFKEMRFLQLLRIDAVHLTGSFKIFPKGLIWLSWKGFTLNSLPLDFHLDNLIVLELQYSYNIKELKVLNKLKTLNLSYSKFTKTPNLLGLPCLEELILEDCERLVEVHESICLLKRLVSLNLNQCSRLKSLPSGISGLSKLESLLVEDCTNLQSISELPSSLETLDADGCEKLTEIQGIEDVSDCDFSLLGSNTLSKKFKKSLAEAPPSADSDGEVRLVIWAVCACEIESAECELGIKISTDDGFRLLEDSISPKSDNCSWIKYIVLEDIEAGDQLELSMEIIEGDNFVQVKELGFYLIEEKPNVEEGNGESRETAPKGKPNVDEPNDRRAIAYSAIDDKAEDSDVQETFLKKLYVEESDDSEATSSIDDEEENGSDGQETAKEKPNVKRRDYKQRMASSIDDVEEDGNDDRETAHGKPDVEEEDEDGKGSVNQGTTLHIYNERWNNYLRKELPKWDILEFAVCSEDTASLNDDEEYWDDDDSDSDSEGRSSVTSDD
ncbi:disease resistance protein RPV1-like isoform X2 [Populus nigra]|uniref:disease resistance protein RPV1-like isoform X2 n=1 Tax=Populus nigra TaxID=3691 RepID=UPI002B272CDE|nr:disease resistance protein RPV1-like isoform X2 [Populus nigra]